MTLRAWILVAVSWWSVTLFFAAEVIPAQSADTQAPGQESMRERDALLLGNGLSSQITQNMVLSRQLLVSGVYNATYLSGRVGTGQITKTGTLTQGATGQFAYRASPEDRLIVELRDATHEFVLQSVQGNLQAATPEEFLSANHALHYIHRLKDKADVEVEFKQVGLGWTVELSGWFMGEDTKYDLSLQAVGATFFENSARSGSESKTDFKLTGDIESADRHLKVDERHFFNLITIGGDTVTHSIDENRNTLVVGEDVYRWVDVEVVKVFRSYGARMRPVFDVQQRWKATGNVLKNDEPLGSYAVDVEKLGVTGSREYQGNVQIVIETPGENIVLQSFRGS